VARINLRDYLSGIEELIDGGRTDEAQAHCRHILTLFPKNIATYRLMGKAFLEAHKHSEAKDIFQRVLSSIPDDFVSHLGLSIIAEEAGDLNTSIWNMERAFEAQPSNRAVQDELRRLYGKREGYAPAKVRLTRGALARMYAHGDLFNQAIGELRSALAEDAQRPDLQVLLAEMYFKTKQEKEAAEVCSAIIQSLPYCLYANRLMVDILRGGKREIEAQPYLERIQELDPYAAHVDTRTAVDSAPADMVMLEQLVIGAPELPIEELPKSWTGTLPAFEKEELPEWLAVDSVGEEPPKVPEERKKTPSAMLESLESLEPIPTGELGKPRGTAPTPALTDDEMPEWLRELRPSTSMLKEEDLKFASAQESERSGETILPEQVDSKQVEERAFAADDAETKIHTKLESVPPSAVQGEEKVESTEADDLSWLEKLAEEKESEPEEELLPTPEQEDLLTKLESEPDSVNPEWFSPEAEIKPEASQTPEKNETLAWLEEMAAEEQEEEERGETALPAESIDDHPLEQVSESEERLQPDIHGTTPIWLKELSEGIQENGTDESTEVEPRPLDDAPDWLEALRAEQSSEVNEDVKLEELFSSEAEERSAAPETKSLDWLEELGPPKAVPSKGEWLPESLPAEIVEEGQAIKSSVKPTVSPRRTAVIRAEQEAPGRLEQARQALNYGKLDEAADHYGFLLRRRLLVKDVIADLDAAVHRHPADATLWQTLGDAYMRNNQLREALDCYTHAEDLL
jgi:cytochrome c-type biogenesis protein CcmH/NrfG